MIKILFLLLTLFCPIVNAEPVATYSGTEYTGCREIGNTNVFLNDPNDYSTIKTGYIYLPNGCSSLPQVADKYLKQDGGAIVEMSQAEKDVVDQAVADSKYQKLLSKIDEYDVNNIDLITALVKVINVRLPQEQKINKAEMIQAIKDELGVS